MAKQPFTIITRENAGSLIPRLNNGDARLLTMELPFQEKYPLSEINFILYDKTDFDLSWIKREHFGEFEGEGRQYRLRRYHKPEKESIYTTANDMFEFLHVDGYEFTIGRMSCGNGLNYREQELFVPNSSPIKSALRHTLETCRARMYPDYSKELTDEGIEKIIRYVVKDLKDGKILAHNVQAGQDADAFLGI